MEITSWKFCRGSARGLSNRITMMCGGRRSVSLTIGASREAFGKTEAAGGSGGYLPTGIGWYRTTFAVEAPSGEAKVFLGFDGVYRCAQIWVNGHLAGRHANGYTGYLLDITPWVLTREQNCLAVRVDNSHQPESRWYTGSGLYPERAV
ncbi:MAG: sugar-binding domain-containing protein [Clostridia bacterium]